MTEELSNIVNTLKETGKMIFVEGSTDEKIDAFENENDLIFPKKFREWLAFSDGGELYLPAGIQLYGVDHKPIINIHNDCRPNDNYIVIGSLASGDPILFEKGSDIISIFNHETGVIESDESFSDFFAFLTNLREILGIEE